MQFSTTLKALVFATACLIPSIAAGPTLADSASLAKKEDCCDPNFFYPCLAAENLGCTPDNINLCSYQSEQDCLALCVGIPGATPPLCS
ncbi:hypothetical protein R3P38DRAFT_3222083 [Favolaschia claudopus]|uniref:Uncharacterized protein n=1 Tax=Favolaschia claudopus TaxID=2862362 RepID=A0AAV9ZYT5_9AGAR